MKSTLSLKLLVAVLASTPLTVMAYPSDSKDPSGYTLTENMAKNTPETRNLIQMAKVNGNFKTFLAAVDAAGLADALSNASGKKTIYVPSDTAFAKIPPEALQALLKDKEQLTKLLTYHVVGEELLTAKQKPGMVASLEGSKLTLSNKNGWHVNGVKIKGSDIVASNGVIHVIDTVLTLPK
jgi:uncharacterized surface protein with fasciclin (FAS1) repeats